MIRSFRDKATRAVFDGQFAKGLDSKIQQRAREKLKYLDAAADLRDLMWFRPAIGSKPSGATAPGSTAFVSTISGGCVSAGHRRDLRT
jgi:hypothetical protein